MRVHDRAGLDRASAYFDRRRDAGLGERSPPTSPAAQNSALTPHMLCTYIACMSPAPIKAILVHMTERRVKRFWSRVDVRGEGECWPWLARKTPHGYGWLSIEPRGSGKTLNLLAHRIAKTLELGRDLEMPHLRHTCHNPACCNPEHLVEGTARDNIWDSIQAGRFGGRNMWGGAGSRRGVEHPAARFTEEQRKEALRLRYVFGHSQHLIAFQIGCHRQSVIRWCREYEAAILESPANRLVF